MAHLYKSRLQNYAQKRNIPFPTYACEMQGPPHARQFKANVTIDGNVFHGLEFCSTLKDAEHAAAKVAIMSLSPDGEQEDDCLYKSLLQELAQKKGLHLPVYSTDRTGLPHIPCFTSTVRIKDECFVGQDARTKKQAEMNAAKVAYNALAQGGPRANNAIGPNANITTGTGASIAIGPRANGTGANNATTVSNVHTVGTSSLKSSCLQTVSPKKIEPTLVPPTSKMQTTINDQTTLSVENESEKTEGYLDLKNFQNAIERHSITSVPAVFHQSQPKATPNVTDNFAKLSIQRENIVTQADKALGANGKVIQPSINEATSNSVVDSSPARPHSTKIVIRPHVPGMTYDGPIHVSDDEWVAMKVNVYEEA
ncbi:uncharacterized protein [Rutidosis leptorrhynchoides]|uniref:uncharacterized protein n=1 Tax=Rutidosis leptorrhynchoides TaxID=125765 RepID=UPI003A99B8EE